MKNFMNLVLVTLLALALLPASPARASTSFGAAWSLAMPLGDTKDFTDSFSLRGFSLEYRNYYTREMAWGLNISYNVFNEEKDSTFYGDNYAVTGQRWTYINAVPMYLSWHRVPGGTRDGSLFYGLNAGAVWLEQRTTLGLYEVNESNVHLGFAPEIGYHFPWQSFLGYGAVRFNYMLEAGDVPAQSWIELRLGFGLD